MDNEHAEKLLVAMVNLTDAIERLIQQQPQSTGAWECFSDGSVRSIPYGPIPYETPVDGRNGVEYGATQTRDLNEA